MNEIKWIKITTDIFDDEKIKLIDSMPEKDTILVIWLKLLTLAGKSNRSGYLLFSDNIPYDEEMLSTLFNRPVNSIRLAIGTFKKFGMITVEHFSEDSEKEILYIANWEKHQNVEGMEKLKIQWKEASKRYRENKKLEHHKASYDESYDIIQQNKNKNKDKDIIPPLPPVKNKNETNASENNECEGDELISNQNLKTLSNKYPEKEVNTAYKFLKHLIKQGKEIKDPLAFLFTLLKNKTYEDITEIESKLELKQRQKEIEERKKYKQKEFDDLLDKAADEKFTAMNPEEINEKVNEIKKTLQCNEELKNGLAVLKLKAEIRKNLEVEYQSLNKLGRND